MQEEEDPPDWPDWPDWPHEAGEEEEEDEYVDEAVDEETMYFMSCTCNLNLQ